MNTSYNRRQFLQHSAVAAAGFSALSLWTPPPPLLAQIGSSSEPVPPIEDPRLKKLVQQGLDAARSAGASYADVRLTHSYSRRLSNGRSISDQEFMTVGVRALADGYWGFAAGPVWSSDEMARLGREAANQATTNALGKPRIATLLPTPIVREGHWTTPIKIDPFTLHPAEVADILGGVVVYAQRRHQRVETPYGITFFMQDKAFGSSEGSYCTQRRYLTGCGFDVKYSNAAGEQGMKPIGFLDESGVGFEIFDEQKMRDSVDALVEEMEADLALPIRQIDVGRYDILLSAQSVGRILSHTIGAATELDRALGFEANASGTSYLNAPFDMLDTFKVGAPALTVTINRDEPSGAATMQWDDDGVVPEPVTVVKEGILHDFQTTRESAGWMQEQGAKAGRTVRSTGASHAPSAVDAPLAHTGNIVMKPGAMNQTVDDLIAGLKKGVFFDSMLVNMDFQQLNGLAFGSAYEIQNGKKVARLLGPGLLFRSPEFWKKLSSLGGSSSAHRSTNNGYKGEPAQGAVHSVTAVPAVFTEQTIVDIRRKA